MLKVKVHGLSDLAAKLKALPAEVASKRGGPLGRALRDAGKVIGDEAKRGYQTMPKLDSDNRDDYTRTNNLAESVRVKRDRNATDVTERIVVRPYARYYVPVEFGSELMPARPELRKAFETKKFEALGIFKTKLAIGIERAARKAARMGLIRG